jgi:hypothetical protein
VTVVLLIFGLVTGNGELVDIGNDDEIAGINVRRVNSLVLATQAASNFE